jgi:hypothetical protein
MDKPESNTYEPPKVIVSLDALGMITDADAAATINCSSSCTLETSGRTR